MRYLLKTKPQQELLKRSTFKHKFFKQDFFTVVEYMASMKKIIPLLCFVLFLFSCKKQSTDPESLPNSYSDQALGKSANDLLSDAKYTTLNIQIQYMPGYAPNPTAISNFTAYINSLCNKPGGVNVTQQQIAANGDTLTVDKVAVIEAQNRTAYTAGNIIAIYILITDGYDTSANTLGFAYRNTSICLFGKNIFDHSGGFLEVTRISLETSILEHEFGHILGLVNLGTSMVVPHQDTVHGNHCNNPDCLMYYAIDTHDALPGLANRIPVLDSNCIKDLRGNGGK